ncbi:MAG: hypothetical protein ACRCS3_08070, partial [Paracoccaceae bacterium]
GSTTRLIKKTNFVTTSERMLYILIDADASPFGATARGAIVVDAGAVDKVAAWLDEQMVGFGADGPIVNVTGLLAYGGDSMVSEAIGERGLEKSDSFFVIEPHFEGREAALTPKPLDGFMAGALFYCIAAFFVLLGLAKRHFDQRRANNLVAAQTGLSSQIPNGLSGAAIADRLIAEDMRRAGHAAPVPSVMQSAVNGPSDPLLSPEALRARIEAAMANPLVSAAAQPANPQSQKEVFCVPPPVVSPGIGTSPIRRAEPLSDSLHRGVYRFMNSRTVAGLGMVLLCTAIVSMMMLQEGGGLEMAGMPDFSEHLGSISLAVLGLVGLWLFLRNLAGAKPVSFRKEAYDPYLRLAERERRS